MTRRDLSHPGPRLYTPPISHRIVEPRTHSSWWLVGAALIGLVLMWLGCAL